MDGVNLGAKCSASESASKCWWIEDAPDSSEFPLKPCSNSVELLPAPASVDDGENKKSADCGVPSMDLSLAFRGMDL